MSNEARLQKEKRFEGICASPGIAHAEAIVHQRAAEEIVRWTIRAEEIPNEINRFETALIATRAELLEMQQQIAQSIGTADASIFDAHLLVVEDRTLIDEVLRCISDGENVEYAFHKTADRYCKSLEAIDDAYLRERVVDIEDVAQRVIRNLLGKSEDTSAPALDRKHIRIARDLTPSDTAAVDREFVMGFATEMGSLTSHTAIMARSLSIPAVVGLPNVCSQVSAGDSILLDGYRGVLIVNPSPETLAEYQEFQAQRDEVDAQLEQIRDTVSTTSDGAHIVLSANIELPDEMEDVIDNGAEGVGLFRSEFLFLHGGAMPDEEKQFQAYREVAERCQPHSVIIRTLDIGGDKDFSSLGFPTEANPFLGCRAIRFCLQNLDIFKTQLRAILRASNHGDVKVMYPMVSGLSEFREANAILAECQEELRSEGIPFDEDIQIGITIEIPSAALTADLIAKEADFFSIGTNDLIQYTIAVDRVNERIAHLYKPTHPSILRLIRMTVDAARANNIWVGVCGEMAGDIRLTPILLGLGIEELSASPSLVPRVKRAVQSLDLAACQAMVGKALGSTSAAEILELTTALARERYGDLL
ncbi:MAG: phosphoenolpyruvate--protein phosphotransferase [Chthoniobacterales bacterium]